MEKTTITFLSQVDAPEELSKFIHKSETIQFALKTVRDIGIITDKRILYVDKQGITGKKKMYLSIPFKNIVMYSIETAGTFDFDSEIKLVLKGGVEIEIKLLKDKQLNETLFKIYDLINDYALSRS